jgi:hypothetical protein
MGTEGRWFHVCISVTTRFGATILRTLDISQFFIHTGKLLRILRLVYTLSLEGIVPCEPRPLLQTLSCPQQ